MSGQTPAYPISPSFLETVHTPKGQDPPRLRTLQALSYFVATREPPAGPVAGSGRDSQGRRSAPHTAGAGGCLLPEHPHINAWRQTRPQGPPECSTVPAPADQLMGAAHPCARLCPQRPELQMENRGSCQDRTKVTARGRPVAATPPGTRELLAGAAGAGYVSRAERVPAAGTWPPGCPRSLGRRGSGWRAPGTPPCRAGRGGAGPALCPPTRPLARAPGSPAPPACVGLAQALGSDALPASSDLSPRLRTR